MLVFYFIFLNLSNYVTMKITLISRRNVMITKEMIKKVIEKVSEENKKECINIKTHVDENLTIFDS